MKNAFKIILLFTIVSMLFCFGCAQNLSVNESESISNSQTSSELQKIEFKCSEIKASFMEDCSAIIRSVEELENFINANQIEIFEGFDLSIYDNEFFKQKALILRFSFEEYDSWTMNDIEIDGGTVLLYGSADQTIYIDSTGNRIESVESPYCFCIEIEQSKIDSATVINWQIAYYDIIETV